MLFFYVRHGDPIYSPDGLTPLGSRQAEAVSRRLCLFGLDKIYASSSERAKLTAQPTCEILGLEPEILDWCHEGHAWQELAVPDGKGGRRWMFEQPRFVRLFVSEEVRALGHRWYEHEAFAESKAAESMARIGRGCDELFSTLGYDHDRERRVYVAREPNDKRVALFAHQGFGLAFLSSLLDIPYPEMSTHFNMGHSGVTVIEFKTDEDGLCVPKVLQLANDSHLYKADLPLEYNNEIRF